MHIEWCSEKQVLEFYAELNATEESVNKDVRHLIKWMQKQPHLPEVTDEQWLLGFHLRCKLDLAKTKERIDYYYTSRAKMPEIFEDRDPSTEQMDIVVRCAAFLPLPKLTPDGYRIVIFHIFDPSLVSKMDANYSLKAMQMLLDINVKADKTRGNIIVFDLQNISFGYVRYCFGVALKAANLQTKITPARYHRIIIVDLIAVAKPLLYFSKTILPTKISDRIEVWPKSRTELYQTLPKECIPEEYGGTEMSLVKLRDESTEFFKTYREWLISEEKIKADLSKIRRTSIVDHLKRFVPGCD